MARSIIRAFPLSLNGKKIAEVSDGSYDIESGDEPQITTEGYAGHSDGAVTTTATFNCVIPVIGMQVTIDDVILNKRYVTLGILANGKIQQVDGRITSGNYTWDHKSGKAMGAFKFFGGSPVLTG